MMPLITVSWSTPHPTAQYVYRSATHLYWPHGTNGLTMCDHIIQRDVQPRYLTIDREHVTCRSCAIVLCAALRE